ncbi:MAG: hypothetical protein C4306_05700 [Thermoleophilia bacterium]
MRGLLLWPGALGLAALVVVGGGAAGVPSRAKNTVGWVEAVAMDGPLVAYATDDSLAGGGGCHKVVAWNVLTGVAVRVSGPARGRCFSDEPHGQRVTAVAIGDGRVAWIRNVTGNTEADDYLYAAALPRPRERRLLVARRVGEPPSQGGTITGVTGDADLLAATIATVDASGSATTTLRVLRGTRLRTVASSPGSLAASSADDGRVAVQGESGVALYSDQGVLLRSIATPAAKGAAVRKDYLLVLAERRIDIFDANTGAFVRSLPVAAGASLLDLHSGIAVYAALREVHALRLATGRDVVVATLPRRVAGLAIEAPGLVYAYNGVKSGRAIGTVVFLPMQRLIEAVSS